MDITSQKIENSISLKEGNDFENFIFELFKIKYPEIEKIKASGPIGDGGNDGYLHKELVVACYAPESIDNTKFEKKIYNDFNRVTTFDNKGRKWQFSKWYFCYNDKFIGISPAISLEMKDLIANNPNISVEFLRSHDIKNMILELSQTESVKINYLLADCDIQFLDDDIRPLHKVIQYLSSSAVLSKTTSSIEFELRAANFQTNLNEKIKINIDDNLIEAKLRSFISVAESVLDEYQENEIEDINGIEHIKAYIKEEYQRLSNTYSTAESLIKIHTKLYDKLNKQQFENSRNYENVLWLLVANSFKICDIGENSYDNGQQNS